MNAQGWSFITHNDISFSLPITSGYSSSVDFDRWVDIFGTIVSCPWTIHDTLSQFPTSSDRFSRITGICWTTSENTRSTAGLGIIVIMSHQASSNCVTKLLLLHTRVKSVFVVFQCRCWLTCFSFFRKRIIAPLRDQSMGYCTTGFQCANRTILLPKDALTSSASEPLLISVRDQNPRNWSTKRWTPLIYPTFNQETSCANPSRCCSTQVSWIKCCDDISHFCMRSPVFYYQCPEMPSIVGLGYWRVYSLLVRDNSASTLIASSSGASSWD